MLNKWVSVPITLLLFPEVHSFWSFDVKRMHVTVVHVDIQNERVAILIRESVAIENMPVGTTAKTPDALKREGTEFRVAQVSEIEPF